MIEDDPALKFLAGSDPSVLGSPASVVLENPVLDGGVELVEQKGSAKEAVLLPSSTSTSGSSSSYTESGYAS